MVVWDGLVLVTVVAVVDIYIEVLITTIVCDDLIVLVAYTVVVK